MEQLTPRERQVLELLDLGCNTWEIVRRLGMSRNAVYTTNSRIKQKLGANNTTHAVAIARERKVLQ